VDQLNRWQQKYGNSVNFVVIYIKEAHANDTWPLGNHVDIPAHQCFEERVEASSILIDKYKCEIPVLYDGMDNAFDEIFAVWPERYFLIFNNKVQYIWYPTTEFGFNRNHMEELIIRVSTDQSDLRMESLKTYDYNPDPEVFQY